MQDRSQGGCEHGVASQRPGLRTPPYRRRQRVQFGDRRQVRCEAEADNFWALAEATPKGKFIPFRILLTVHFQLAKKWLNENKS